MIYDILVATAVGMVAGLLIMVTFIILFANGVIDNRGTEHFMDFFQNAIVYRTIAQVWVAGWVIGFFVWFWRNGGQTIGMRAWRMRLFSTNDSSLGYGRALLRMVYSLGGLGTLMVLLDFKHRQSLQDRLAKTEMLVLSKQANDHKSW